MEFRVLGPLEVLAGGQVVPVGGSRERSILARLLISANEVVSQDSLLDDLWPGDQPEGAAQALWVYLSRLRKALRSTGDDEVLVTRPPGYVLAVGPGSYDAARFEALVRSARDAASAGHHADAAATLTTALALWRGPALSGVAELPFAQAEAARLEEARLSALEARISADLACGKDDELIGELASLTREHPLRERLWALRMTALYRAGRQAEALRTYQQLRRYLGEELGIEPSEELRTLEGAILRQESHLARPQVAHVAVVPDAAPGVITFLFTDLVGSTELLDQLGDEAADDVRRRHFSSLRQALAAHGGSEVKSLGDGLMAAFASPVAAVKCAVEIQRAAATAQDPAVSVRVGIHAGEPTAEEDDFFGTPVVVAQRLCGRARGGQILTSALVQGLVGGRAGCSFATLGGVSLKGFAEPIAACSVEWAAQATASPLSMPVPLRQDSFFVRPEADMVRLESAWQAARSGRRQLLLLAGEPGIGKSRRSAEIARHAHEAGAIVLYGRCEDGMGVPYQPFVEALGTYLRNVPSPTLGRLGGELVRLDPELPERVPALPRPLSADPETERYRLFDAVAGWLAAVAREAPVVFVVEDIHWATPPTLAMLSHLVRSGEPERLLVVANYRDTRLDVTPELADTVADLLRQPGVDRLELQGLDQAGVTAYMEAQARQELDAAGHELAGVLHAETAGNPFFLGQVLRHLGETEAVTRIDGKWSAGPGRLDVPASVRDVIARRLARLPGETYEILSVAAVQGDRFDLRVLVEATGQPQISVLRALDPAITARLVTESDGPTSGYRFVHALVRHTLYDALSAAERMARHRDVGLALAGMVREDWREHATDLARHWLAATPQVGATTDDARRTLDYVEEAARRAAASFAYEEAAEQLNRALLLADRVDDPHRMVAIRVALGEAQDRAGDRAHRKTLFDAARSALRLGDTELAARALLANQRPMPTVGVVDKERVAALEELLQALGPEDSPTRARVLVSVANELQHSSGGQNHDLAREAIAVARRLDDPPCLAYVLSVAGFALWGSATLEERAEIATELNQLGERLGDPVSKVTAGLGLFYANAQQGELDRGRIGLQRGTAAAEELRLPALRIWAAFAETTCAMLEGRFADAERLAGVSRDLKLGLGEPDSVGNYNTTLGYIRILQGRAAEAATHFEAAVNASGAGQGVDRDGFGSAPPGSVGSLALAYAQDGRLPEARAVLDSLGGVTAQGHDHDYIRLGFRSILALISAPLGDRDLAARTYEDLLPYRSQYILVQHIGYGPIAYVLGLLAGFLGRFEEADDHFEAAVATSERNGARGCLPTIRLAWARLLVQRDGPGDRKQVRKQAEAAAALADELDLPVLAEQARELLDELAAPTRSRR